MKYTKTHTIYYNTLGVEVPSVTTVLKILNKPFLTKWANIMGFKRKNIDDILNETSRIGTMVHSIMQSYLMKYYYIWMGDPYDKMLVMSYLNSFIKWEKDHYLEPIFMEKQFILEDIAGTCDFYGSVDGFKTILDFKTSKKFYSTMFLQLAAYCIMLEERGYIVEQACIVLLNEDKCTSKIITREELEIYIIVFRKLLSLFHDWFNLNNDLGWGDILGN